MVHANGYEYCPYEAIQVINNNANHWILLSTLGGELAIFDSLNMKPTSAVITQITQLFSPDNTTPLYHQYKCFQQHGGTDCGIFATAYAVDLLEGSKPYQFIYDQSKMRQHLIDCFEAGKITLFPKYVKTNDQPLPESNSSTSEWVLPRRSQRIQNNKPSTTFQTPIKNRFEPKTEKPEKNTAIETKQSSKQIHQITPIVHNTSGNRLSSTKLSILSKGLNFCPSTKDINTEQYCRK